MKPILVIQMQRMGDLILSFPLFLWLERSFPGHPIWVMAEPQFAAPLARLSPMVRYLGGAQRGQVEREKFFLVINLSHRPESRDLAGRLDAEALVGGYARGGVTRVAGAWQEYRASLTHNNRHNRFHWAELNALDVVPLATMAATRWPAPRIMPASLRKIGLFLGASEPDKRPTARFWADLVRELERRQWIPVLLGGPAEKPLAQEVLALVGHAVASACGTLGLDQFALFGQGLAAMITPDTGPMHLAAWSGLRVLNLSMGPVHAWETGPYQPGHVVLRATRDCVGCWQCRFERPRCQDPFAPSRVARILDAMLKRDGGELAGLTPPGLEILRSGRAGNGLYNLAALCPRARASLALGAYWQAFWLYAFGLGPETACRHAAAGLRDHYGRLVHGMLRTSLVLLRNLSSAASDPDAYVAGWAHVSPALRPLSGYAATHLANHDFAPASVRRVIELAERHLFFLSPSA